MYLGIQVVLTCNPMLLDEPKSGDDMSRECARFQHTFMNERPVVSVCISIRKCIFIMIVFPGPAKCEL